MAQHVGTKSYSTASSLQLDRAASNVIMLRLRCSYWWGTAQSLDMRGCSRSRATLRLLTPPRQRRTHRTHGCAPLKRRRRSAARSTGACSSPLGADMVGKSRNKSSADVLVTLGLLAGLDAADHLLCEGAVCTRLCGLVLRRCHATPVGCVGCVLVSAVLCRL